MKLIINADDAGIDEARNRGIFKCVDVGMVKNLSVVVCQAGWQDIIVRLRGRKDISAGLHFNLTAGRPLREGFKTICGQDGSFFNKFELLKRSLSGFIDTQEVIEEMTAQLDALRQAGIDISHVDGHNHVHLLPGVREAARTVLPQKMRVRLAFERRAGVSKPMVNDYVKVYNDPAQLVSLLNFLSQEAKKIWGDRFLHADDFAGTAVTPQPGLQILEQAIKGLKGEICELMCHPGDEPDEGSVPFSRLYGRQEELRMLTSTEFREFLMKRGIKIVSYRDIAPK